MAIEKSMNSRVLLKNDIESNWMKAVNFIPKLGEAIIYNAELDGQEPTLDGESLRPPIKYPRVKIGDGITGVNNLPFITEKLEFNSTKIYIQNEAPDDVPDNTIWLDLDAIGPTSGVISDDAIDALLDNRLEAIENGYY